MPNDFPEHLSELTMASKRNHRLAWFTMRVENGGERRLISFCHLVQPAFAGQLNPTQLVHSTNRTHMYTCGPSQKTCWTNRAFGSFQQDTIYGARRFGLPPPTPF